jgi:hypothetical protein
MMKLTKYLVNKFIQFLRKAQNDNHLVSVYKVFGSVSECCDFRFLTREELPH